MELELEFELEPSARDPRLCSEYYYRELHSGEIMMRCLLFGVTYYYYKVCILPRLQ